VIAAWMIYVSLFTAAMAGAAHATERALRLVGRPGRWAWIVAIVLSGVVPLATITRAPVITSSVAVPEPRHSSADRPSTVRTSGLPSASPLRVPLSTTVPIAAGTALSALDVPLRLLWLAGSLAWCSLLVATAIALSRRVRRWTPTVVDGVPVLVSHAVGPAVIGVLAPEIVLPAWILDLPPVQRALALAHELEHARARDPLLLIGGALAIAVMPWNLALWYAFSRLRLAVEADCDTRVLRLHPDVRAYGSFLVDVSERTRIGAAPVVALTASTTHLARRLELMTSTAASFTRLRFAGFVFASLVCTVVACRSPHPVAASPKSAGSQHDVRRDGEEAARQLQERYPSLGTIRTLRNDSLYRLLDELHRSLDTGPRAEFVADSILRRHVAERFPAALTGGMGSQPALWFLVDADGTVLRTATGREALSRDSTGREVLDWTAVMRAFPGLPASMSPGGFFQWSALPVDRGTVSIMWVRLGTEEPVRVP